MSTIGENRDGLARRSLLVALAGGALATGAACRNMPAAAAQRGPRRASPATLIRGGFLYTADATNRVVPQSWVLVEGARIAAIGDQSTEPPVADRVIDATGKMILPGFVNPHWHESFVEGPDSFKPDDSDLVSTSFSQGADIEGLGRYFRSLANVEDRLDPEDALVIARYSLWTQLRGGTTLIGDTGSLNSADAMAQAALDLGMRINVGRWASDIVIPNEGFGFVREFAWQDVAEDWEKIIARWAAEPTGLVRVMPSVLVSFTSSDEQLLALKSLVDRHGVNYAAHLGAVPNEADANRRAFGKTAVERFDDVGLLGDRLLAVHTNRLTESEFDRLVKTRTNICFSPANYGLLGERSMSETRMAARFIRAGVSVSTSTDGNVSFAGGMPEAMRAMHLMVNESMGDNTACTPTTALACGTRHGAAGLGRGSELGSIEVGKLADLVMINIDEWRYRLVSHPLSVFLVAGCGNDIETVMVGGCIVVEGGRSVLLDEEKLFRDYARVIHRAHEQVFGATSAPIR